MLDQLASSTFGFWIVAVVIVAVDQAILLTPGTFAFTTLSADRARLRISNAPFTLRNKELVSSLVSFPFQFFFVCSTAAPKRTPQQTRRLLARMHRLSGHNAPLTILSMLAALILIAGPFIAASRGVALSIIVLLPLLYLLSLAGGIVIWWMRKPFGLSQISVLKLAAELVLCPVFIVNVSKRVALAQRPRLAPSEVAACTAHPEQTLAAIDRNLQFYRGA